MPDQRPIAVFDSGLGGLTVVRAIRRKLPRESLVYFGDTARVPYGIKSPQTVTRFAIEDVRFLLQFGPKAVVVACNTASAVAVAALRATFDVPIWDVIEPGAAAAAAISDRGAVGLLATEATVASQAYPRAIARHKPAARVFARAAPLLVTMVEEGRTNDQLVRLAIAEYLQPLLDSCRQAGQRLAGLLLGCTHYPLLTAAIRQVLAEARADGIELIDSAERTAARLADELPQLDLALPGNGDGAVGGAGREGKGDEAVSRGGLTCLVSDNAERFARIGSTFLGEPVEQVRYVSPDEFFAAQQVTVFKV